jgi:aldose 1-epimerase
MEKTVIMGNKTFAFILSIFCISILACNNTSQLKIVVGIKEKKFGNFDNIPVTEYTITNKNGVQIGIINFGGIITKIITPDNKGIFGDVVTGFDSISGYLQKEPFFGALIGRYANRIAKAKFTLEGKEYRLVANDGSNALHGGNKGFDKVYWNIEKLTGDSSLKLIYNSKDGEEGYPGNLKVEVVYSLTSNNEIKIEYTATTDQPTPVNLTNHTYFNLSAGADSTIFNHELLINANRFTPVDATLIPLGILQDVQNSPMDFKKSKLIGKDISQVKGGFDHNWVLNKKTDELSLAAVLYHPASGRQMEVFTTQPGIQFYSGNFLDGTLRETKKNAKYIQYSALCLETQHFPNSPNQPNFPNTILKPGESYHQTTIYKFSTK